MVYSRALWTVIFCFLTLKSRSMFTLTDSRVLYLGWQNYQHTQTWHFQIILSETNSPRLRPDVFWLAACRLIHSAWHHTDPRVVKKNKLPKTECLSFELTGITFHTVISLFETLAMLNIDDWNRRYMTKTLDFESARLESEGTLHVLLDPFTPRSHLRPTLKSNCFYPDELCRYRWCLKARHKV